ncbi:YqiA/YcfP family alpha/beta fold hydrolase, partial [Klebsiella pneumoniae]|uniref:YqiA/YcfP family alpha/beta fold hydrolase n=1 Tax=Klebsiella pneumoniae TaxID=573 RepID=UPI003013D082
YGLPAVLINPAAYPYDLMNDYLGTQTNLYTGEAFEVTREDVERLRDLDPGDPSHPERLRVMLQTGDETLAYREAERRFAHVHLMVEEGGD